MIRYEYSISYPIRGSKRVPKTSNEVGCEDTLEEAIAWVVGVARAAPYGTRSAIRFYDAETRVADIRAGRTSAPIRIITAEELAALVAVAA